MGWAWAGFGLWARPSTSLAILLCGNSKLHCSIVCGTYTQGHLTPHISGCPEIHVDTLSRSLYTGVFMEILRMGEGMHHHPSLSVFPGTLPPCSNCRSLARDDKRPSTASILSAIIFVSVVWLVLPMGDWVEINLVCCWS